MEFRILGPLRVNDDDGQACPLGPVHTRLLAVLLLAPDRVVAWQRLVDAVWDDDPPATARRQIQNSVSTLRRRLAAAGASGPVLVADRTGYRIRVGSAELDAEAFRAEVAAVRAAASAGRLAEAAAQLRSALARWRGPALAGCPGRTIRAAAARLDEQRLTAIEECLDLELRLGRHDELVGELVELVAIHPLRERLVSQLMLALHGCGRQAEALDVYQQLRVRLAEEIGLDPSPRLRDLYTAILRNDPGIPAPAPAPTGATIVPRQLPAPVRHFVGRNAELKDLTGLVDDAAASERPLVISAIDGTAGIGKTTLALHWAHQMAGQFPDGQLYVNLRGFDAAGQPTSPAEAIRGFLDAFGVDRERIPHGLDAQVGLYRSLLAGRRVLVVLDNARDADQVRPLLPGSPRCLVVVTSRNQLTGLVATAGAYLLTLDLLSTVEAHDLLACHLGRQRLAGAPAAVDKLVTLCGRLPLALAIVAARATARPTFPLSAFVAELAQAHRRLDALDAGDPGTQIRAVFSWSYQRLSDRAARLYRLLGLHPGPDLTAGAAASLAGEPVADTLPLLGELTAAHLLAEHTPGRYAFHDLVRAYAAELAYRLDGADERHLAVHRMLDHYLHSGCAADRLLDPRRDQLSLDPPVPGAVLDRVDSTEAALHWFTAEHQVVLAAVGYAVEAGFDGAAWRLAWSLSTFLSREGHWRDWVAAQHAALAATERLADRAGQARSHNGLGLACSELGRYAEADTHYRQALDLFGALGDHVGQARTHTNLCWLFERQERPDIALEHARHAVDLYRTAGDRAGEADALNNIGWYHAQLGDHEQALTHCQQALAVQRNLGHAQGQADAWDSIGFAHHHLGRYARAVDCYRQAIELYRQTADRAAVADVLVHLGDSHRAAGEPDSAREAWHEAESILNELDHPDAAEVRTRLADLDTIRAVG